MQDKTIIIFKSNKSEAIKFEDWADYHVSCKKTKPVSIDDIDMLWNNICASYYNAQFDLKMLQKAKQTLETLTCEINSLETRLYKNIHYFNISKNCIIKYY